MRTRTRYRWAIALVERLGQGGYGEAMAGDLQEELRRGGRGAGWLCWQVAVVLLERAVEGARGALAPAVFAAGWSLLFPMWRTAVWSSALPQSVFDRWAMLDWPASALLLLGGGLAPVVTFLWLGFFVYMALRAEAGEELRTVRVVLSLSLSVSVLLVLSLLAMSWWGAQAGHAYPTGRMIFRGAPWRLVESVPLALSLLAGILAGRSRPRQMRVS